MVVRSERFIPFFFLGLDSLPLSALFLCWDSSGFVIPGSHMKCGDISSGLFEFDSPGAAFRHDLNQFALRSSAIWAAWLTIPVIWSWLGVYWFGSNDLANNLYQFSLGIPWLFGRRRKQNLELFRLVAGCGLDLLRFPLFFVWRSVSYSLSLPISVFPPFTRKLFCSLLDLSFLFYPNLLSLSQNLLSIWLLNYWERKIVYNTPKSPDFIWLIDCLFSSILLLSEWVKLSSVTFLFQFDLF